MTTLNLQIASGNDDSCENLTSGACSPADANVNIGVWSEQNNTGALRFQVNIAQGATINTATLSLNLDSGVLGGSYDYDI